MSDTWKLSLSIEARGHDDTNVRVVRPTGDAVAHLKVRTGEVVVHCLGPAAAMSAAALAVIERRVAADGVPHEWADGLKNNFAERIALAATERSE